VAKNIVVNDIEKRVKRKEKKEEAEDDKLGSWHDIARRRERRRRLQCQAWISWAAMAA